MHDETGLISTQVDVYNGTYFHDNMSIEFLKAYIPQDWLFLESAEGLSGNLDFNQSTEIFINVNTENLPIDEYTASVILSVSNQQDINIAALVSEFDLPVTGAKARLTSTEGRITTNEFNI